MKIPVNDSDGKYRGGVFKTKVYNAKTCRVWRAPPRPYYREHLIDDSGRDKPRRLGS